MNDKAENKIASIVAACRRWKRNKFQPENVKKILVIRTEHLGDMVCTIPFIRELRRAYKETEITLLCSSEVYNLVEIMPYVDYIKKMDIPKFNKHVFERTVICYYNYVQNNFRGKEYDIVFTPECPTPAKTRILANFINSRKVVSYYIEDDKIKLTDTNFQRNIHSIKHVVLACLDMLLAVGKSWDNDEFELWQNKNDICRAKELLAVAGLGKSELKVVMFLSTTAAYKDWDVKNYAEVAKKLQEKYNAKIILLGAKSDTEGKGREFMKIMPDAHNFIGMTSIRQTYEIICRSDLYVGGDTGTMHLAAASKIPGVVITKDYEGASGELLGAPMERFYPWKSPIRVLRPQKPLPGCEMGCYKTFAHCINQISPEVVWQELVDIIEHECRWGRII